MPDSSINQVLTEYFRCPEEFLDFASVEGLSPQSGHFQFDRNGMCYGHCSGNVIPILNGHPLYDAIEGITCAGSTNLLPFDPVQVIENLRRERYRTSSNGHPNGFVTSFVRSAYDFMRPAMPVSVRKHLQRVYLRDWKEIPFPGWPVDRSVDYVFENLMELALRNHVTDKLPFIWFWPDGYRSCTVMTHDIETKTGRDFSSSLMDIDESFGIKASFEVVPEERYSVSESFLENIRNRGFEINVHDLNHDGSLFRDRREFLRRAGRINQYGRDYGAKGFRSGVMYRNADWYDALEFCYDMSVPNVAHLEPQRGGCCTVMPFFIGTILELPLTTTQDYSLFHILGEYSIELWKRQIASIMEKNGLISFIIHPDYIIGRREWEIYLALLRYLSGLRREGQVWMALPREVDSWWRARRQMKLVWEGGTWRIEGAGRESARIAHASLGEHGVAYSIEP